MKTSMTRWLLASLPFAIALFHCGAPMKNTPVAEIPKLTSLEDVMDNQATVADPQMKKAGQPSYADADWAAFADMSTRLQATSLKIKDFSKGADFDALAMQLNAKAKALGDAAAAKDVAGASGALTDIKATCKQCHSKFR
jgi:cytochrome c556